VGECWGENYGSWADPEDESAVLAKDHNKPIDAFKRKKPTLEAATSVDTKGGMTSPTQLPLGKETPPMPRADLLGDHPSGGGGEGY